MSSTQQIVCGLRIGRDPPLDPRKIEKMCQLAEHLRETSPINKEIAATGRVLLGAEVKKGEGLKLHCGPVFDKRIDATYANCFYSSVIHFEYLKQYGKSVSLVCGSLGFRRKQGDYWYEWGGIGCHPNRTLSDFLNNVPPDMSGFHCWDWHVWVAEKKPDGTEVVHDVLDEGYVKMIHLLHGISLPRKPYMTEKKGTIQIRGTYDTLRRNFSVDYIPAAPEIQRELFRLAQLIYGTHLIT
jgi:hypothetical protein